MADYDVDVSLTLYRTYTVSADSETEAQEMAEDAALGDEPDATVDVCLITRSGPK